MPYDEVMGKFKRGTLHSGSKAGPAVTSRKQAVAIMLSEKRSRKAEYHSARSGRTSGHARRGSK
jgi:hypothetical protein